MRKYLQKLFQDIASNPIQFDYECDHPALDCLYWHYGESHVMANEHTKAVAQSLEDCLTALSFQENDRVFSMVGALCAEHERIAFLSGLQLGAQLMLELFEP